MNIKSLTVAVASAALLSACAGQNLGEVRAEAESEITPVASSYDMALACLGSIMTVQPAITVGRLNDATGKTPIGDGSNGSFIMTSATDIAMSAVMKTQKAHLINSTDFELEKIIAAKLGQKFKWWKTPDGFISGSINRLDFLPGGAASVNGGPASVGYREFGVIAGLDMFLTDPKTGAVLRQVSVEKKMDGWEVNAGFLDFFGTTLAGADISVAKRAAIHMAVAGMVKHGVYSLLSEWSDPAQKAELCDPIIKRSAGAPAS